MATANELSYPSEDRDRPKTHDWAGDDETHHIEFAHTQRPQDYPRPDTLSLPIHQIPTASSTLTNGTSHKSHHSHHSHKSSSTLRRTRSALGLHPSAPINEDHDLHERQKLWWSRVRIALREPFAEFWGVVIMILFGDGSVVCGQSVVRTHLLTSYPRRKSYLAQGRQQLRAGTGSVDTRVFPGGT
jgi:hypothetical protein